MRAKKHLDVLLFLRLTNGFDRGAFNGIAAAAQTSGDILIHVRDDAADHLDDRGIDGLIVSTDDHPLLRRIADAGKPCVNIANCLDAHALAPVVGNDDDAIGRLVAQHYLDRGFRSFAYFTSPSNPYFNARRDAFVRTLSEAGVGCAVGPTATAGPGRPARETSSGRAGDWLASLPRPLAVMSAWDIDAREAILACRAADLRVPEDVSIIGVDNDEMLCLTVWPHLSSVATPAKRVGYEAMSLLRDMIVDGRPPPGRPTLFPAPEIIVRGSSSETAVQDPEVAMAINFITAHIAQRMTVEDLVAHTAISRRALERRFLKSLGRTPMDEIRRLRVERAKRLLIDTDLGLADVARRSGLIRQQRLCGVIKAETGKTPLRFRHDARPGER